MRQAILGGWFYFLAAFTAGFALGVIRVLILEPRLGATAAVLIELPAILLVAWFACRFLTTRLDVPAEASARVVMGISALAFLLVAEFLLARGLGRSTNDIREELSTPPGLLGFAGQILFALLPQMQLRFGR